MEGMKIKDDLFGSVKYFTSGNLNEDVEGLLKLGGAQSRPYISELVTHLICGKNYNEEEIVLATDLYSVTPVNEKWILQSAKLGRLASTKAYSPSTVKLFSNIVVAITQLSLDDRKRLFAIITFFGGQVQRHLSSRTTHLISGAAGGNAYFKALTLNSTGLNVVSPDWIIDCIKRKELINTGSYHPRLLLNEVPKFIKLSASNDSLTKSLSSIIGFEETLSQGDEKTKMFKEIMQKQTKLQQQIRAVGGTSQGNIIITSLPQTQQGQQQVIFVRPKSVQQHNSNPQQVLVQQKYIQQHSNNQQQNVQAQNVQQPVPTSSHSTTQQQILIHQVQAQAQSHTQTQPQSQSHFTQTQVQAHPPVSPQPSRSPIQVQSPVQIRSPQQNSMQTNHQVINVQLQRNIKSPSPQQIQQHQLQHQQCQQQQSQTVTITPQQQQQFLQQHLLRQQQALQQQQNLQQQGNQQQLTSQQQQQQQQIFQRQLQQQQQNLLQQNFQQNQHQQSPRANQSQSPTVHQDLSPQTPQQHQSPLQNQQPSVLPQSPRSHQPSPSPQMTPPPPPPQSPQLQQTLTVQQQLRQQIQQNRNVSQQQIQMRQGVAQILNSANSSQSLQQQLMAFNQQQQKVQQIHQSNQHQQRQQQVISKQIDPTDANAVAQVLSRTTPSPSHQHEQNLLLRQQIAAQHLKNQQLQQQTGTQAISQQTQSIQQQSPQQQIIISQGNQIITQRHVINTSTTQGQQIIQSHMLNIQQHQQQHNQGQIIQQNQGNQSQIIQQGQIIQQNQGGQGQAITQSQGSQGQVIQQSQGGQSQVNQQSQGSQGQLIQQNQGSVQQKPIGQQQFQFAQSGQGHVRIIQGQQIIGQQQAQTSQNGQQQQFQQVLSTQQSQISAASQTQNKQFQTKFIITQQQFNQLSPQQQQQLLQNQQNQNIIIINQSTASAHQAQQHSVLQAQSQQQPQSQQQNAQQNIQSLQTGQNITLQQQHQQQQPNSSPIHTNQGQQIPNSPQQQQQSNLSQMLKNFTQKQQQQIFTAANSTQMEIDQQVGTPQPQQQQHQVINQQQTQQMPQQIVINQQQNQQRIQYLQTLQHHQQLQLQLQNKQNQQSGSQQIIIQQPSQATNQSIPSSPQPGPQQASNIPNASHIQGQGSTIQIQNQLIIQQPQQSLGQQQNLPLQASDTSILSQNPTQQVVLQSHGNQGLIQQQAANNQQSQTVIQQQVLVQQQNTQSSQPPTLVTQPQQQVIVQQQPGLIATQTSQQWSPQNSAQQPPAQGGSPVAQQQFIRAIRPQWQGGAGGPQRQLIQLDDKTHAHFLTLDPVKKAEYIAKLQNKQRIMLRQQVFQARPGVPVGPRPGTQHIIVQSQMPPGLTQQQQMQWLQQQGARQVLVRSSGAPGLSPLSQQAPTAQAQFVDNNTTPQAAQQQQLIMQRQQQLRLQQLQLQREQAQKNQQALQTGSLPTTPEIQSSSPANVNLQQSQSSAVIIQESNTANLQQQMNSKTKTALANMLSNRLGNNGGTLAVIPPEQTAEPSAAGTLRLMTAQHNASLNQAVAARTSQELLVLQQQQQQQRRTLGNITNNTTVVGPNVGQTQSGQQIVVPQSPTAVIKGPPFSPVRAPIPTRPQFYGHNPNLKLPPDLFLLGCTFFIVEYDESHGNELPQWIELIERHGGEIEKVYCQRVTHVLCRTQRHGVVMQAIRDSKRCVTAYWLSDTIIKKQVVPPWQALHLPMPSTFGTQKPAVRHIIAISGFVSDERERIKRMVEESGAKLTGYMSKHNTVLICRRPEGLKYKKAKEWNIPVVNTAWLSDIVLGNLSGMSQYESTKYQHYNLTGPFRIDHTLVPLLMAAWKAPINLTQEAHERVKRSFSEPTQAPKQKKIKTNLPLEVIPDTIICNEYPNPDSTPKICFSQVENLEGLKRAVTILGGMVVEDPSQATHLVMTKIGRSCKFLRALCVVDYVVTSEWVIESAKAGKFLPTECYKVRNKELETTFNFSLDKIFQSPNRRTLFNGKIFYITPSVYPSKNEITKLIEICGGKVETKRRSAVSITETNAQSADSYILVTCPNDLHLLADLTRPGKPKCLVCSTEIVMSSIMKQKLEIEPNIIQSFYNHRKH